MQFRLRVPEFNINQLLIGCKSQNDAIRTAKNILRADGYSVTYGLKVSVDEYQFDVRDGKKEGRATVESI